MTRSLLGFPILGQSNSLGHGTQTYPIRGQHWRFTPTGLFELLKDENGNQRASRFYKDGRLLDTFSMEGALCDTLAGHAVSGSFATIPCGKDGSASTEWVEGLTVLPNPTVHPSLIQAAKHRINDFLRCTGAALGAIIIYQGETNATIAEGPQAWLDDWDAICDDLAPLRFAGGKKFVIVQLPPTQPRDFDFPYWAELRAAQETFVSSVRADDDDCVLVQAPENALVQNEDFHLETGADESEGLRKLGSDIGTVIAEQFGIEAEESE